MHTPYQIVKRIKKNPRDGGILGKLGQRHAIDKFEDESVFVYDFVQFRDTGETEKLLVDFALSGEEPPSEKKTVKKVSFCDILQSGDAPIHGDFIDIPLIPFSDHTHLVGFKVPAVYLIKYIHAGSTPWTKSTFT